MSPERSRIPSKHRGKICYYHRTYGDDIKKCQSGCNYLSPSLSRADLAFSKFNPNGQQVTIIPRSAKNAFFSPPTHPSDHLPSEEQPSFKLVATSWTWQNLLSLIANNPQRWSIQRRNSMQSRYKLIQTDTRELTIELPNLADGSSSIHEDIQNLLPEHSTIPTNQRNKCKREKTSKATASNRQSLSKSVAQIRFLCLVIKLLSRERASRYNRCSSLRTVRVLPSAACMMVNQTAKGES
nr:hypothetical protein HmN_000731800 [Hymenolepis microstoma]